MENLKARELRLGNYLKMCRDNIGIQMTHIVEPTTIFLVNGDIKDTKGVSFKPIPLTEDILLKWCGAIKLKTKSGFIASYKLGRLTINVSSSLNYYYRGKVYNNLHQLQNLYEILEQEELTIKL